MDAALAAGISAIKSQEDDRYTIVVRDEEFSLRKSQIEFDS